MTIETTHILLKRGNTVQSSTYTGPSGEVTVDTDLHSLRVHDGVTPGGNLVSSGTGPANTGNWSFLNNAIHNLAGGEISNGNPSHGYTAGIILPVNGAAAAIVLNNTYGNVILQSGANSDVTASWTFGSGGVLKMPDANNEAYAGGGIDFTWEGYNQNRIRNHNRSVYLQSVEDNPPGNDVYGKGAVLTQLTVGDDVSIHTNVQGTIDLGNAWIFGTDGGLTFPDALSIKDSIIGKNSTNTITEEDPAGTTTETTVIESQIEIEASGIVIAKRIIQTFDDGVVTAVDEQGSVLTLNNSVASIKRYADPAGPNNIAYSQFTTDGGAKIETVQEDVGGIAHGRVNATLGSVQVSAKSEIGDQKYWLFDNDGSLTLPNNSTISPVEQVGYTYGPYATDIYGGTLGAGVVGITYINVGVSTHATLFNDPVAPASTITGTIAANGDFEPGTPTTGTFTRFTLIIIDGQRYGSLGYRDDANPSAGLRIGQPGDTYEGGTIPAGIRIDGWRGRQTVTPKTTTYIKWADGSSTQVTGSRVRFPNESYAGIVTADDVSAKLFPATIYTANYSAAKTAIRVNGKQWGFGTDGSLTVPQPTSTPFTLTFAATNYVATGEKPTLTLTGDPWELHGQYVYASDGRSSLMLDDPFPILTNPGYDTSDSFTFGADVHGIIGYTLTITLDNVVEAGPAGWTANVIASAAPAYPSTILTSGAIKLTTNNNSNWIFGTDGKITFPGANGFQATFGSVEPIGDVLHSVNSLVLESEAAVNLFSGNDIAGLEMLYNDQLTDLTSLLSAELYGTSFLPASHDSIIALAAAKASNPLISDQIITVAQAVSDAWDDWQAALTASVVNITVGNYGWTFGADGNLTVPTNTTIKNTSGDINITSPSGFVNITSFNETFTFDDAPHQGRFIMPVGGLITGKDNSKVTIQTAGTYGWDFGADGHVVFPDGSIQTTAFTGLADNNIWIETFASDEPSTDFVQAATSVEYDLDGNIIALFNHIVPTNSNSTYTSVAKLTPTGAVLWRVRFGANLNTDGWGLAYDTVYNYIYIAGSTGGPGIYKFATLTKLSSIDGSLVWSKTYDFEADSQSSVVDVGQAGDPVMVGYAYNGTDNYIVTTRINRTDGSVVWCKTINGQGYDQAYGMAVGPDSEVVTIGYVDKLLPTDSVATAVTEPTSNVNWTTPHTNALTNGVNFDIDISAGVPTIIINSDENGGRVVGDTFATILGSTLGGQDGVDDMIVKVDTLAVNDEADRMVVIKYASDGVIAWQKVVQFEVGYNCTGADADIDTNGNIYVCGQYSFDIDNGNTDSAMNLIKFDSAGVKQWSRRVVGNCQTFATSVVLGDDGYLYLSGITGNNNTSDFIWVVAKYDTDGLVVWQRLIDNTTTWTFGAGFWFGSTGGGSNIAVHDGYVALAGAFADPFVNQQATAVVVQIDTDATPFSVGDWDIKAATFSGLLNNTASDITVVDAGKAAGDVGPSVGVLTSGADFSNFLTVIRYSLAGSSGSSSSIDNGAYSVGVTTNGVVSMVTSRGSLEFGALPEPGAQSHFHIMKASGDTADLFLGDDFNYVLQRGPAYGQVPGYGVEIGTNDHDGGVQHSWRFGTDGTTFFPDGTNFGNINGSGTIGFAANVGSSFTVGTIGGSWEFGTDGALTLPGNLILSNNSSLQSGTHFVGALATGVVIDSCDAFGTGVWRVFVSSDTYPTVGTTAQVGDTLGGNFDSQGYIYSIITEIAQDTQTHKWIFIIDTDFFTPWFNNGYTGILDLGGQRPTTWTFNNDTSLTLPRGEIITGVKVTHWDTAYGWGNHSQKSTVSKTGVILPTTTGIPTALSGTMTGLVGTMYDAATYGGGFGAWKATDDTAGNAYLIFPQPSNSTVVTSILEVGDSVSIEWGGQQHATTIAAALGAVPNDPYIGSFPNSVGYLLTDNFGLTGQPDNNVGSITIIKGTHGPFTRGGVTFSVTVAGGGISGYINISSTTPYAVNASPGTLTSEDLGDPPGQTTNINVESVVQETPTAFDLTKSINKLTSGVYTLADGVEGQIMYLVRQTGSVYNTIMVNVANARVNGGLETTIDYYPFDNGTPLNMSTLIFTDGAWQADSGSWD